MFVGFGYYENKMFKHNLLNNTDNTCIMTTNSPKNDLMLQHARLGHVNFRRMH